MAGYTVALNFLPEGTEGLSRYLNLQSIGKLEREEQTFYLVIFSSDYGWPGGFLSVAELRADSEDGYPALRITDQI